MPILKYYGDLWGFSVLRDDEKYAVLCHHCYEKAQEAGRIKKVLVALGTEGTEWEFDHEKHSVYVCDDCVDETVCICE